MRGIAENNNVSAGSALPLHNTVDLKDKGAGNVHTVKSGRVQHLIYRLPYAVRADHHRSGSQFSKIIL